MADNEKNADEIIEKTLKEIYQDIESFDDQEPEIDAGNFDDDVAFDRIITDDDEYFDDDENSDDDVYLDPDEYLNAKGYIDVDDEAEDNVEEELEDKESSDEYEELEDEEDEFEDINPDGKKRKVKKSRTDHKKKNKKGKKMAAIIISSIFGVLAVIYIGFAVYFNHHFMFSTQINGVDFSLKSVDQVESYMGRQVADYSLILKESDGDQEVIHGSDISLQYVPGNQVGQLAEKQNNIFWIQSLWRENNIEAQIGVEYDEEALKQIIDHLECLKEENQTVSVDAHPEFQTDKFVIVPEVIGTQINREKFDQAIVEAINGFQEELDLTETECYIAPKYVSDSKEVVDAVEKMNSYLKANVTYDFNPYTEVVDSAVISQWVKVDADMKVTFDEEAVKVFVQSLADKYDTKGRQRSFVTATGNTVTVSGGGYGWKIDQEAEYNALLANIQNGDTVTREPNYSSRAASHAGNDVGSTYAEVDLTNQRMYFIQNGQIVLQTDVVTGNPNKGNATPQGVYSLSYKALDQVLRGTKKPDGTYEYETPVKYWMPFNGGIGFHDAPWQAWFGGSRYQTNGSHGCVNMPSDAAAQLYNLISAGTPVVVHF